MREFAIKVGISLPVEAGSTPSISESQLEQIVKLRNVIGEQLCYAEGPESDPRYPDTSRWFCLHIPQLGSVFAWYVSDNPLVFQGISHSLEWGLIRIMFPELSSALPKLNSILIPALVDLAKDIGAIELLVYPLTRQGRILTTYYEFTPTETLYYPSPWIMGAPGFVMDFQAYCETK